MYPFNETPARPCLSLQPREDVFLLPGSLAAPQHDSVSQRQQLPEAAALPASGLVPTPSPPASTFLERTKCGWRNY